MTYYLFLDDERSPADVTWIALPTRQPTIVRSYVEFVACVERYGVPDFVSFDHDLADAHIPERTGYDCAKWLVEYCADTGARFPDYTVHSMNPLAAGKIDGYVASARQHLGV